MGVYDTYGSTQLKISDDRRLRQFNIGDKVEIPDGVYVGYAGLVVIVDGIFVAEFENLTSKWGVMTSACEVLGRI